MYIYINNHDIVSSEMCTWDLVDGQCIESVKIYQVHSYIQVEILHDIQMRYC